MSDTPTPITRPRMKMDLNPALDANSERRRMLKLSFEQQQAQLQQQASLQSQTQQPTQPQPQQQQQQPQPSFPMDVVMKEPLGITPLVNRERLHSRMQATGKLQMNPDEVYDFTSEDLQDLGEIGRGGFGSVNQMIFKPTNRVMAVKRIRSTVDEKEQKQLLMDLDVVMKSNDCNYIVQFYGALFKEGDCWICMELMDTSLDKFYKFVCEKENRIPESILAKISLSCVNALHYLKDKLNIIHRDVKPSNILLHSRGDIKLCDFGISGQLIDSIAKTKDAGCRPYMAPERIDPQRHKGYDVRSDVWSLGITMMEVATGKFPYPKWCSVFEQLFQVVHGDPPSLTTNYQNMQFSEDFVNFVNTCLIKDETLRPKYSKLLQHPFILQGEQSRTDVAAYVTDALESMARHGITPFTTNQPAECWSD